MTGRGGFITLEGIEGAGKTTQLEVVRACLADLGVPVIVTREPGGSPVAERIRSVLLDPANKGMAVDAELLLMFAARAEHLEQIIWPALERGTWVVCDRFTDATYAYQGGGRGIDARRIARLEDYVQGDLRPDLTLLFDLPVQIGLQRARRRSAPDRFESETQRFFEDVRGAYLALAAAHPSRIRTLDASAPESQVSSKVCGLVSGLLGQIQVQE